VPSSFVPEEDEGYFIAIIQAPSGSSLEYTTNIAKQAEQIIMKQEEVLAVFSVAGFSFSGSAPNQGLIFARLKPFEERQREDQSLHALLGPTRIGGQLMGITGAIVAAFAPPAIQGLQTFGGFTFEVLDGSGGDISNLAGVTYQMMGAGNAPDSKVMNLFSSFTANDPQLVVQIDRDRARSLGLPIREITDALAVLLGSAYINDFDFNNRAYRVYAQADEQFRGEPSDLRQFYARAQNGQMVPLDTVVRLSETTAPSVISHFNMFRRRKSPARRSRGESGQGIVHGTNGARDAAARLRLRLGRPVARGDPRRLDGGLSLRTQHPARLPRAGGAVRELDLAVHHPARRAARGVGGAQRAVPPRLLERRVLFGRLVMLIGLAAKNSILIVEFAEHLRKQGMSIVDAAVEASRIRLRPILMTSFAFVLGVMPLAYATGAGSGARNSVGTTVAGGMLASTFLSIVFIPVLYVAIRTIAPGRKHRGHEEGNDVVAASRGAHA
jgi:HAE1 family hydrophobic/amphiphilic exporter-1